MSADGGVTIDNRRLRSAIEFAVAISEAGQRLRPPLAFPPELKPHLRANRIPTSALGPLRRAIEADDGFRRRLAAGVVDELVDPIGREWLCREDGWEQRIAALVADEEERANDASAATQLRRAEKRREAAEQVALRTRAELVAAAARLETMRRERDEARRQAAAVTGEVEAARRDVEAARRGERHANDRARAAADRLGGVEAERAAAVARAAAAEGQRDALLAERAQRSGAPVSPDRLDAVRELARQARGVAERLERLVATPAPRTPLSLPGGAARESARATEHLLRSGAVVLVDGYNVAKLGWPDDELATQRERLLEATDDLARRFASDLVVVFDGAEVTGGHTRRRRLTRVTWSPSGVTADDVIRAEVAAVPSARPVVVVTNDQAIRRDVAAAGANTLSSDAFLAVAGRTPELH